MSLIAIRPPASVDEYERACALVEEVYYEHRITSQRRVRHPKAIFVAVHEDTVLGSVGFLAADQGTLPAEFYFGLAVADLTTSGRASVFEIVKLAAKERTNHTVFRGLVAACAQYAFVEHTFSLGLAIAKPSLQSALRHFLHVPTGELHHSFIRERAAADYPRYFLEGPAPVSVTFQRNDCHSYLGRLLAHLEQKATVHTRDFDHQRDYGLASSYPGQPHITRAASQR